MYRATHVGHWYQEPEVSITQPTICNMISNTISLCSSDTAARRRRKPIPYDLVVLAVVASVF